MFDNLKLKSPRKIHWIVPEMAKISPSQIGLQNKLAECQIQIEFSLLDRPVTLTVGQAATHKSDITWDRFALACGDQEATVFVAASMLPVFLENKGFNQTLDGWDQSTTTLVYEHFIGTLLEQASQAFDAPIHFVSAEQMAKPPASDTGVRMTLLSSLFPGGSADFVLEADGATLTKIIAVFENHSSKDDRPELQSITQQISWRSPGFDMPFADIRALCVEDVLLLDQRWQGRSEGYVWINNSHTAQLRLGDEDTPELASEFQAAQRAYQPPSNTRNDMDMNENSIGKLDDLPITLSIEFDSIELPLAEVEKLDLGSIVPFGSIQPKTVTLLANGNPFAEGELLETDGQIGLRIVRIA